MKAARHGALPEAGAAPRRVLMTADAVGGVWTHALELARGLAAHGVEVALAVPGPEPDALQRAAAAAVPGLRLLPVPLGLEWQDRAGPLGAEDRRRLRALEAGCRPCLVHVNGFREAAAGFRAPVLLAAHSCVRTWWRAVHGGEPPPAWDAYARGVARGLAASGMVAAPSRAFAAALRAAWGPLPAVHVVENGLDLAPPAALKEPLILTAGRLWDEAKNVAALARVAPALPWPVLVAGEGGERGEGLVHLGRLAPAALHRHMAAAAIYAAPARYEPFGLAILEAAKAGCALVLGRIASLVELWDGAARFVPPDDPQALQGALLELIADEAERRRLQGAARERAGLYSRERMTQGYLGLYAGLLEGAGCGRERAA